MSALAAPTSPLKQMMTSIREQTELTKLPPPPEEGSDAAAKEGERATKAETVNQLRKGANSAAGRIGYAAAVAAIKDVDVGGGGGEARPNYGERIEAHFKGPHDFAGDLSGSPAPVDNLVARFNKLYEGLNDMKDGGPVKEAAIKAVSSELRAMDAEEPRLPGLIANMTKQPKQKIKELILGSQVVTLGEKLAKEVTAPCSLIVRGKYPFKAGSRTDVGLADFQRLFGPGQIMDGFFNRELAAMANTSGKTWRWSGDTEVSRNLSNATLRQFQRARQIRDAFFGTGALGIQFSVTPISLSPDALDVTLDADGQKIVYDHRAPRPVNMVWPGPANGLVVVAFTPEIPGQRSRTQRTGTWALIRLMRANAGIGSGGRMSVTFRVGGRDATFSVQTQSVFNPFKMTALNEFTCPKGI